MKELLVEGREHKEIRGEATLAEFMEQVQKFYDTFTGLRIPIQLLNGTETLSYLYSTVSDHPRPLHLPKHPMLLDKYLYDTPLYGGLEPKLNKMHIRVISPIKYSKNTTFGCFDALNQLDFSYRWSTRCFCLSKADNLKELERVRRKWKAKLQKSGAMSSIPRIRIPIATTINMSSVCSMRLSLHRWR